MESFTKRIAVYGATGHTGAFVVREAVRHSLPVVAVGRDAARLTASLPASVPQRTATLDDPVSLERAFTGCAVVINCAGPFLDTATPVARAALQAGCHYIDVTAEQASAQACFDVFDQPARVAARVVIPAAGFFGGLADLLASALAPSGPVDTITVAIGLDHWWPTLGTRRTGARNTAPRVVMKAGQLTRLEPVTTEIHWTFSPPLGRQSMVELPFSEVNTLAHHLTVGTIRSLLNRSALEEIRDAATPPPAADDTTGRSAQRFEMIVQVEQGGITRTARARGRDIYAITAPIVIEAALRLLPKTYQGMGAMALAEAVLPLELLSALQGRDLEVFGIDLPG